MPVDRPQIFWENIVRLEAFGKPHQLFALRYKNKTFKCKKAIATVKPEWGLVHAFLCCFDVYGIGAQWYEGILQGNILANGHLVVTEEHMTPQLYCKGHAVR